MQIGTRGTCDDAVSVSAEERDITAENIHHDNRYEGRRARFGRKGRDGEESLRLLTARERELDELHELEDARRDLGLESDRDVTRDDAEDPATGELDLADRYALRRVVGFSTELEDVTEVEYRRLRLERVVLVGVWTSGTVADAENSLQELAAARRDRGLGRAGGADPAPPAPGPRDLHRLGQGRGAARRRRRHRRGHGDLPTASSPPASVRRSRRSSRSRSSTAPRSSSTSSPSTPRAGRARPRSSSPSSSTCCRACAAGVSRCPARPVARSAAAAPASAVARSR